ncbi:unnamed protein product [Peronospora farinosa]|uniref:RRM domain-containing protein n=1 Tax=Peronospora farinosa TaxID=134698 RepID=A0AAV0TGW9_9STRA|nr:unnamed protein product [Peronospora farinosa]
MGTRVYVGGLPRDATSREIQDGFNRYGHVSNIWVARNPPGFAFVDFEDPRDADDAIRSMDGRDFLGGRIRVELARGGSRRDGGRRDGGGRDGGRRGDDDRGGNGRGGGDRFERGRNPPQRTDFRVRVTDLPRDVDWRNVKDFLRTGGEVTYCNIEADGSAVAEFQTKDDMDDAIKKLDDTEFRGSYVRVAPEGETQVVAHALVLLPTVIHRAVARVRARLLRVRTPRAAHAPDRLRLPPLPTRPAVRMRLSHLKKSGGLCCGSVESIEHVN